MFLLSLINIFTQGEDELRAHLKDCDAVVSCLGHNLSLGGIWGAPYRLCTDTTRRVSASIG